MTTVRVNGVTKRAMLPTNTGRIMSGLIVSYMLYWCVMDGPRVSGTLILSVLGLLEKKVMKYTLLVTFLKNNAVCYIITN